MFVPYIGVKAEEVKFENKVLVVSCNSFGDIGSLAIDLMAYNNDSIDKVGYYKSDYLQSIVANLDVINFQQSLALPAEIYTCKDYVFLQFRTVFREGRKKQFLQELSKFISEKKFSDIIVLSSGPGMMLPEKITKGGAQAFCLPFKDYKGNVVDQSKFVSAEEVAKEAQVEKIDQVMVGSGFGRLFYKSKEFYTKFSMIALFVLANRQFYDVHGALYLIRAFTSAIPNNDQIKKLECNDEDILNQQVYKLPPSLQQQVQQQE